MYCDDKFIDIKLTISSHSTKTLSTIRSNVTLLHRADSPDHYPNTFGLLSPASGFSDPMDDDDSFTERRGSYGRPMVTLGNGYCPTHGILSHSPLPSSSGSPRGSMNSDATCRLQSPGLTASPPSRQYVSPRPPRQRQAATMTSPPLGGYRVMSPHHGSYKATPPTPRHIQSMGPLQRRASTSATPEEVLCSTVTTFGVSASHIPTMSQIATDV